jgi:hypothetical protein
MITAASRHTNVTERRCFRKEEKVLHNHVERPTCPPGRRCIREAPSARPSTSCLRKITVASPSRLLPCTQGRTDRPTHYPATRTHAKQGSHIGHSDRPEDRQLHERVHTKSTSVQDGHVGALHRGVRHRYDVVLLHILAARVNRRCAPSSPTYRSLHQGRR